MTQVVVIGSGIAGVSVAHALTVRHGLDDVLIVDPGDGTAASGASMECYRTWVSDTTMRPMISRSVDLIEDVARTSGRPLGINQRGYLMVTGDTHTFELMVDEALRARQPWDGRVRHHPGDEPYPSSPDDGPGVDVTGVDILGTEALHRHYPHLPDTAVGALHLRRGGWLSAYELRTVLMDQAQAAGTSTLAARIVGVESSSEAVSSVVLDTGERIQTSHVVDAAGTGAREVAALAGVDLPLTSTLHRKVSFRDHLGIFPRDSPVLVNVDPQRLDWDAAERAALTRAGRADLVGELPPFCHGRIEGGTDSPWVLVSWPMPRPGAPATDDPLYPEVAMRGMESLLPGLTGYRTGLPRSSVDGAWCAATIDGRPLAGPTGIDGLHVIAGLGGIGIMAAMGLADLVALHITGRELPPHAAAFLPRVAPR